MSEELLENDQSHYEVSLTAGQAFLAFVLLLLSLAACFAFGLMIGRSQADERLVVRKEPAVITEAGALPKKSGRIQELGVSDADFKAPEKSEPANAAAAVPTITEETVTDAMTSAEATAVPVQSVPAGPAEAKPPAVQLKSDATAAESVPHYAQLLSTGDQKTAEALAAKLINAGFTSAYVERGTSDKGPLFRVRIKFASETDAHAAEPRLHAFSKDVWITKQ